MRDKADKMVEDAIILLRLEKARLEERIALIERKIEGFQTVLADTNTEVLVSRKPRSSAKQTRTREPIVGPPGTEYDGMTVREAVAKLLDTQPELRPAQIRDSLEAAGFPFQTKSPLNSVWRVIQAVKGIDRTGTGSPV